MLFARLRAETTVPDPSSRRSPLFAMHRTRHKWLDSVAPFGGGAEWAGPRCEDEGKRKCDHRLHDLLQLQV